MLLLFWVRLHGVVCVRVVWFDLPTRVIDSTGEFVDGDA